MPCLTTCCYRVVVSRDDNVGCFIEIRGEFVPSLLLPQNVVANFYWAFSNVSLFISVTFVILLSFTFLFPSLVVTVNEIAFL